MLVVSLLQRPAFHPCEVRVQVKQRLAEERRSGGAVHRNHGIFLYHIRSVSTSKSILGIAHMRAGEVVTSFSRSVCT